MQFKSENIAESNSTHSEPSLAPLKQTIKKQCSKIHIKIWFSDEYGYSHNSSPSLDLELQNYVIEAMWKLQWLHIISVLF